MTNLWEIQYIGFIHLKTYGTAEMKVVWKSPNMIADSNSKVLGKCSDFN